MSKETQRKRGCLASQQFLTHEYISNKDYAYKALYSISGVKNLITPAILTIDTLIQNTGSTLNTPKEYDTTMIVSTDTKTQPP